MMKSKVANVGLLFAFVMLSAHGFAGEGWRERLTAWRGPAAFPQVKSHEEVLSGTRTLRFEHECLKRWGYTKPQQQYFYLVPPARENRPAPLLVVLHTAGGTAEYVLKVYYLEKLDRLHPDFYTLHVNSDTDADWWWGWYTMRDHPQQYAQRLTPTENRVFATIQWVMDHYPIDRNRVYLHGISMGGSGALGLGLAHGELFASIFAGVPAGVDHGLARLGLAAQGSSAGVPDPPPLLMVHSQVDRWSKGQESLLRELHDERIGLVYGWGPWGHVDHYEKVDPAVIEFPWLSIRRNEAYPVFTNASTDQCYPGHLATGPDQNGQLNAYFRWASLSDTRERLVMELRLVTAGEFAQPLNPPAEATADVTLRRLQNFKVKPGEPCHWRLERAGDLVASGQCTADGAGLVTIPRLSVTATPERLILTR